MAMLELPACLRAHAAVLLDDAVMLPGAAAPAPRPEAGPADDAVGCQVRLDANQHIVLLRSECPPLSRQLIQVAERTGMRWPAESDVDISLAAELIADAIRQWRRLTREGQKLETGRPRTTEQSVLDSRRLARTLGMELELPCLVWFGLLYHLVPCAGGPVSIWGGDFEPRDPRPVAGWWSEIEARLAERIRRPGLTAADEEAEGQSEDDQAAARARQCLQSSARRQTCLFEDGGFQVFCNPAKGQIRFEIAFPQLCLEDSARDLFLMPAGRIELAWSVHDAACFCASAGGMSWPSAHVRLQRSGIMHPFMSRQSEFCSGDAFSKVFSSALSPGAKIVRALKAAQGIMHSGDTTRGYRAIAESGAPKISRRRAKAMGIEIVPFNRADRGMEAVER